MSFIVQLYKTKEFVESNYTVANGYSHDAEVVYGDTDSVRNPSYLKSVFSSVSGDMKLP